MSSNQLPKCAFITAKIRWQFNIEGLEERTSTSKTPNGPSAPALGGADRSFGDILVVSQLVPPLRAGCGICVSGRTLLGMLSQEGFRAVGNEPG